jgi:hypothetical protein
MDLARPRLEEGCGAGRGGRTRGQHVVHEQEALRRLCAGDGRERVCHREQPLLPAAAGLWSGLPRPAHESARGEAELPGERSREDAGLVEAALGPPPAGERHPRHGVGGRRAERGEGAGKRFADPTPAGELESTDRFPCRTPVRERRPHRGDRRQGAVSAAIHVRGSRAAAPATPRRLQRDERTRAGLAERPRTHAAPRTDSREQDVDGPIEHLPWHRSTLRRAADIDQGSATSTGSAPLIEIVTTDWVFMTG